MALRSSASHAIIQIVKRVSSVASKATSADASGSGSGSDDDEAASGADATPGTRVATRSTRSATVNANMMRMAWLKFCFQSMRSTEIEALNKGILSPTQNASVTRAEYRNEKRGVLVP